MDNLHRSKRAVMACAGLVGALASMVMLGWIIRSQPLVQLHPTFVPMVFNTALCFLLCAASAGLSNGRASRIAPLLAAASAAIGAATLAEYASGWDWGINTVFVEPFAYSRASAPGAMATNTALAFVLSGAALTIMGPRGRLEARPVVAAALLGSLIMTIGIVALIGEVTGANTATLWGVRTRMAAHTAAGFVLLGLAVTLLARQRTAGLPRWLPLTVFVGLVAATLAIAHATRAAQTARVQRAVLFETEQVARLMENYLNHLYATLEHSARTWDADGGIPRQLWETLSISRLHASQPLSALIRADVQGYFQWIAPAEQAARFGGKTLHDYPMISDALRRARATHTPQVTTVLPAGSDLGGGQFLYLRTLNTSGNGGETMLAAIDVAKLFTKALPASTLKYLSLTVKQDGVTIFSSVKSPAGQSATGRARISNLGRFWHLETSPTPEFLATTAPIYIVAVGSLIACLAAYSTLLMLRRQRDLEALRLSEERLALAVSGTSDGLWDWDIKADRVYGSPRFVEILGAKAQTQSSAELAQLIHREDREAVLTAYHQHTRLGAIFDITVRLIRPDGKHIWLNLRGRATRDASGRATRMTGFATDMSHVQDVERLKTEFIANVSHELRTPLTSIRGALALIQAGAATSPAKLRQLVELAQKNSERLIQLVNDLLDISGTETGQLHFSLSKKRLNHLLRHAVERHCQSSGNTDIVLIPIEPDAFIEVDPGRFEQVLNHLIANAVKFSPMGEIVTISAARRNGRLRISVADCGPGIAEEFRPFIFERFRQGDGSSTRAQGGTGVGLYISRQIVRGLGGQIGFDTEVCKGSTFWFELPDRTSVPAVANEIDAAGNASAVTAVEIPRPRILHIEEDPDLRLVISQLLGEMAEIVPAATLDEALGSLAEQEFDLVILDPGLHDGNIADVIERLAVSKRTAPLLILSDQDISGLVSGNAATTLVKSRATEAEIAATVTQLLHPRRAA